MKKMNKNTRKQVFDKFGGRCAYCGCELDFDKFQIDHFIPQVWAKNEGLKPDNSFENLMPACVECNRYKSSNHIEGMREWLESSKQKLLKTQNLRILNRVGGFSINEKPIRFYFETINNRIMETDYDFGILRGLEPMNVVTFCNTCGHALCWGRECYWYYNALMVIVLDPMRFYRRTTDKLLAAFGYDIVDEIRYDALKQKKTVPLKGRGKSLLTDEQIVEIFENNH